MIDYKDLMTPLRQYNTQRYNAKKRGIEFLITFEEWMNIWELSGHFKERGRCKGQYVMSRKGDTGPYSIENVFIQSQSNNHSDVFLGKIMSQEQKDKIGIANKGKSTQIGTTKSSKGKPWSAARWAAHNAN